MPKDRHFNALKHGAYSEEVKAIRRYFNQCRELLREVGASLTR